jgi:ribonucleoside-triphosphate reductase
MYNYIKKRDGRRVAFHTSKIMSAIERAGLETGEFAEAQAHKLAEKVVARAEKELFVKTPSVEQIQDIVEEVLLESRYKKTAKAYIIYRDQHEKIRDIANAERVDLIDQYLSKLDWRVNENSNMDYSLQGLNNCIARAKHHSGNCSRRKSYRGNSLIFYFSFRSQYAF